MGARKHLAAAGAFFNDGKYLDAMRESIQAVESVARVVEPSASTLGKALPLLEKRALIRPEFRQSIEKLYVFSNSAEGIRHADLGRANEDEAEVLLMISACAAFVTYLVTSATKSGAVTIAKT